MDDHRKKIISHNREKEDELRLVQLKQNAKDQTFIDNNINIINIPEFKGCFTKTLRHDQYNYPNQQDVINMVKGIRKNKKYLERIKYPNKGRLINPSVVFSLELMGPSKSTIYVHKPPKIHSKQLAADLIELYNMALIRDLPFSQYKNNELVKDAIKDLNNVCKFTGPTQNGKVTVNTLFRGNAKGDLIGPYISQLLYLPYNAGALQIDQQYNVYPPYEDFMTTWETALDVHNGNVTESMGPRNIKRYIITMRDLCTYVKLDDVFADIMYADLVLKKLNCPWSSGFPYGKTVKESAFVDCGDCDLYACMSYATRITLMHTWYHKWNFLMIRPEELCMNIQQYKTIPNQDIPVNKDLLDSKVLDRIYQKYKSYLLPQAYSDGCPSHPSYPQGHGATTCAAATILKAFKNEDFEFDAVEPNEDGSELHPLGYKLRVGDEIDKLVSNIALGRSGAGVHYRCDCSALDLGQQIAIDVLEEYVQRYCQPITFKFHKRNGELVVISNV